jgi:hypothetical protein
MAESQTHKVCNPFNVVLIIALIMNSFFSSVSSHPILIGAGPSFFVPFSPFVPVALKN